MTIESKISEIVEKALVDKSWDIVEIPPAGQWFFCNDEGFTAIVHALLTSEEITVKLKEKPIVRIRDMAKED